MWSASEGCAKAAIGQKQIIQAAQDAGKHTSSLPHEELVAAVHPYMTHSQAAVLAAKHTVHNAETAQRPGEQQ